MKKSLLWLVTLMLVVTFSLVGCKAVPEAVEVEKVEEEAVAPAVEEEVEEVAPTEAATFKAGIVLPVTNVFYLPLENGVKGAIEAAGGEAIVRISQGYKIPVELANVEDLLQQDIDVLFIDVSDKVGSSVVIEMANKANVPVFGLNQDTESGEFVTIVATQNYNAGKLAAEFVMEQIQYRGKVVIMNGPAVTAVLDRIEAFYDVVAEYPDVEIVADQEMGNTIEDGITVAENMLQANPDMSGFLCMNDWAFIGAITALQSAGKVGEVAIGAIDGMPEVVGMLAAGLAPMSATASQLPYDIGEQAVQAYLDYRDGKDVPEYIRIEPMLITKDNAQGFSW